MTAKYFKTLYVHMSVEKWCLAQQHIFYLLANCWTSKHANTRNIHLCEAW